MRNRIKDFAYFIHENPRMLLRIAEALDSDESRFYRTKEEPKLNDQGQPIIVNGQVATRKLLIPNSHLKHVQKKILTRVLYKLDLPKNFYGGVKGLDAVWNARFHQGNKYIFQTDLKSFFPSISHTKVLKSLKAENFEFEVASLITRLCTCKGELPQGCPTSSFLSALHLKHNAGSLFRELSKKGYKVSLYIDDITISSPVDFRDETSRIINSLREIGLKVNFDKTTYSSSSTEITGVHVKNNAIYLSKNSHSKLSNPSISKESKLGIIHRKEYLKHVSKTKRG
ncbi:MAG: RNA-directed DNA polymerase [Flavobacteriia bacterium]|nr:RNA-directed DNA polymerase [Flavobacteriia bacterium]